jgi:NAD(P)-dependent dehydrogenase (short-subunit alcohol dehydrogenase family)
MAEARIALVTGGSSGIGQAIAVRLGRAGFKVAAVGSADPAKTQLTVDQIVEAGGEAEAFTANVSDVVAVKGLVEEVTRTYGRIDVLVNAAGVFLPTPIGDSDVSVFDRTIDINVKGAFYCITAVAPLMIGAKSGVVINISSVAASLGVTAHSAYCASKAALSMMTRTLALELAPHGVNINAIAPGNTATPMNEGLRTDPKQAEFLEGLKKATPSMRIFSRPEDIAELAFFLTTDAARAMHGSTLLMDEGISAGV